jgi:hypothetical protein
MKQGILRGFGAPYLTGAVAPADMPDDVVTSCNSEADAIRWSIAFARKRFGYTQLDIAKLCGWDSDNHLSSYKRHAEVRMPDHRRARFAQVTGCNLLEQYTRRQETLAAMAGAVPANKRDEIAVARMLAVAA